MKEMIIEMVLNLMFCTFIFWFPPVVSFVFKTAGKGLYKIGHTFAKVTYTYAHRN